jgi:hypothetical protein
MREIFDQVGGVLKELAGVPLSRLKESEWSIIDRETSAATARRRADALREEEARLKIAFRTRHDDGRPSPEGARLDQLLTLVTFAAHKADRLERIERQAEAEAKRRKANPPDPEVVRAQEALDEASRAYAQAFDAVYGTPDVEGKRVMPLADEDTRALAKLQLEEARLVRLKARIEFRAVTERLAKAQAEARRKRIESERTAARKGLGEGVRLVSALLDWHEEAKKANSGRVVKATLLPPACTSSLKRYLDAHARAARAEG